MNSILKNLINLNKGPLPSSLLVLDQEGLECIERLLLKVWNDSSYESSSFEEYWSEEERERIRKENEEYEKRGTKYVVYNEAQDEKFHDRIVMKHGWGEDNRAGVFNLEFDLYAISDQSLEEYSQMLSLYLRNKESRGFISREELFSPDRNSGN